MNFFDAQDPDGNTALMLLVRGKDYSNAERLLKMGANYDLANKEGQTVFDIMASQIDDAEFLKFVRNFSSNDDRLLMKIVGAINNGLKATGKAHEEFIDEET